MPYLLNAVYICVIALASPWLLSAAIRHGKYRDGFAEKFLGHVPKRHGRRPCIWLHAVSVGEVNLLATLLEEIETRWPEVECVISTTTKTGYELAIKKYAPRSVFYCPLDFSWAVHRALERIRPDALVLAELELWPNLIRAAKLQGVKVAIVNGRLSEKSFRGYRRLKWLAGPELARLDLIAAQNDTYAERFAALLPKSSTSHVQVTGSLKFDGAQTNRGNAKTLELARLAGFTADDIVFVAGSTQAPEEELALAAFRELSASYPTLRLVLVPRHKERFDEVARLLERSGLSWRRRSELANNSAADARVLLVDTIGELGAWWGTATIAFVGGSFGSRGGQNMIEPAAYGAAVSFGPKTRNFRDIVALLLAAEAAVVVSSGEELTAFVRHCLADAAFAERLGQRAKALVQTQLGATQRTVDLLAPLMADVLSRGNSTSQKRRAA